MFYMDFRYTKYALSFVFVFSLGCGGTSSEGTTPAGKDKVSATEAMGLTRPDIPWAEMSEADKEFYMIGKVNPIMQELFARHDSEEYSGFSCEQCHGVEMREINFEMPAPSMYVVPPEGTLAHKGMMATFPETVAFMEETVTPAMGKLLGHSEYTCAGCHPSEAPKPKKKRRRSRKKR